MMFGSRVMKVDSLKIIKMMSACRYLVVLLSLLISMGESSATYLRISQIRSGKDYLI